MFSSLALLAFVSTAFAVPTFRRAEGLAVVVNPPAATVSSIEDLVFTAEVTNTGPSAVKVLKYATILDELPTRSFEVTKDGASVPFVGVKVCSSDRRSYHN